jgi:predicted Zn-dependent peptidase
MIRTRNAIVERESIAMENIFKYKLDSGATVIAEQNKNLHSICIGFYFKAGVIYESYNTNGISHLLEHLFFRDLCGMSQRELYVNMEKIGAPLRACTYRDFVRFSLSVSPKYFNDAFDIVKRILLKYDWKAEDIKKEKEVVKNQILFKTQYKFNEFEKKHYFKETNLRFPIMGTVYSVDSLSVKKNQRFQGAILQYK